MKNNLNIFNKKILFKSIIYRIYSFFIIFIIFFIVTNNPIISLTIGLLESIIKVLTYYLFDLLWIWFTAIKYNNYVVWLTGLSGAGKTTIAKRLVECLKNKECRVILLDGDEIRNIFKNNGFDKVSRDEHVKNVGRIAAFLQNKGIISIVSLISPYEKIRNECRKMSNNFIEVYVNTPIDVCEQRDVKGLYKKAREGTIKQFTGIHDDAPYEVPQNPEIKIDTTDKTIDECVNIILNKLKK